MKVIKYICIIVFIAIITIFTYGYALMPIISSKQNIKIPQITIPIKNLIESNITPEQLNILTLLNLLNTVPETIDLPINTKVNINLDESFYTTYFTIISNNGELQKVNYSDVNSSINLLFQILLYICIFITILITVGVIVSLYGYKFASKIILILPFILMLAILIIFTILIMSNYLTTYLTQLVNNNSLGIIASNITVSSEPGYIMLATATSLMLANLVYYIFLA